ncbi:response regulator [Phenylobacterium sp.]|uniref:response regulator n=1 Tax=Phenylobacterium sp. TaxID=1871053 RepID=UPI0012166B99|nr:response regulator [Phenylobacterium sp.]THD63911.1 MAG: response regulator [Phenylobacterium sp.]
MIQPAKPIVLIVEDETLIRMLAVDAFLEEGFDVLEAEHAAEALQVHADAAEIHVLFTDVNMPGALNGIDLAERLKAAAPTRHLIITSALPILRPVDHLPATFVSKPYDAGVVSRTARAFLAA